MESGNLSLFQIVITILAEVARQAGVNARNEWLMDGVNDNKMNSGQMMVACSFGSSEPRLASFSHIIFSSGLKAKEALHLTLPGPLGIWPHGQVVDAAGHQLGDLDSLEEFVAAFSAWEHPKNQEIVWEYLGLKDSVPFSIFMRSDTSPDILLEMYQEIERMDWDVLQYDAFMELLSQWLDRIGWVVVPLEPEGEFTLMAVSESSVDLLVKVQMALEAAEVRYSPLVQLENGQYDWPWGCLGI